MKFAGRIKQINMAPKGKRGSMFESLVKDVFSEKFARIETWPEYAKKHAKYTAQDLGIDLVAYDSENTKHAIQCKYRSNGSPPLRKQDIDKFVSACHAHRIDKMILAHTESALKPNVCETCRDIDTYGPKRLARLHNTRETNTNGNVWNFPPTGRGGQEYGFNQAGFEIFGGRQNRQRQTLPKEMIESVVRELLQNSLDAKMPNEACRVKFERLDIDPDAIAADDLAKHMDACKEQDDHPEFFKDAGRTLRSSRIDSIRVTDSNTTGLNKRGWRACIVVEGRSAKESDTDGGSYGLGKNAPFAMSSVGVVCYATRLPRGSAGGGGKANAKSVAKCRAISHVMSSEMRQHIGELDSYGQTLMRPGTSITIVGTHYITSRKDWLWEFVKAVKRNFFIAIANGSLECAVEGRRVKIDESAESDMPKDKRQKRTPAYLEAVRMYDGGSKKTISSEGLSFDIWAAASSEDDNKYENICMYVNKRGMLITREKSTRRNPFHIQRQTRGSFLVLVKSADDFTERQMRDMEPPSHAEIKVSKSPDYIDALRNIKMKIESHVRDMLFADSDPNDVAELSDLADILPIKRDAEEQTKLDVFITKPKKKHGTGKADGGTGGTQEGGKTKDTTGGGTNGGTGGGPTTEQQPQGGEGDGSGVETQLEDIRMVSGSRDSLQVYGTLSGDNGGKDRPVNVIIRRMSESKEHDEKSSRIQIKTATAAFVGEGGDEVKAEVKIHEDGRILAITTGPSVSGRRLKLDVTLNDPEPVRCAYEIGVVSTS